MDKNPRKCAVILEHDYHTLQSSGGISFAILDSSTSHVLKMLGQTAKARSQAAYTSHMEGSSSTASRPPKSKAFVDISVNIYVAPLHAKAIGDVLSKERRFLQHPDIIDAGIDYVNPQYLVFPGQPSQLNDKVGMARKRAPSAQALASEVEDILNSLDEVQGHIDNHLSDKILTPMLKY